MYPLQNAGAQYQLPRKAVDSNAFTNPIHSGDGSSDAAAQISDRGIGIGIYTTIETGIYTGIGTGIGPDTDPGPDPNPNPLSFTSFCGSKTRACSRNLKYIAFSTPSVNECSLGVHRTVSPARVE